MRCCLVIALLFAPVVATAAGQSRPERIGAAPITAPIGAQLQAEIDALVTRALAASGDPSVSISIARAGAIAYTRAYGNARLDPALPATPSMRYKIGSISKQFVAASMLLLEQDGKLDLDDKVARYIPGLTRARDISLRQLLNHTAGYEDFYPLDIVTREMRAPITADALLQRYGRRSLGFEPGRRWAYSNTNYVIAGRVIEKVSGMPLDQFIATRIAARVGLASLVDVNRAAWSAADTLGYTRNALGPMRVAPAEGRGWTFAAGQLAMTAVDLARWDLALMNNTLLTPASRAELTRSVTTDEGGDAHYGLGLGVETTPEGRVRWSHGGGVGGYMARNVVYPNEGLAIVVLTNTGSFRLSAVLEGALENLLLPPAPPAAAPAAAGPAAPAPAAPARDVAAGRAKDQAAALFAQLQKGAPERRRMTADLQAHFSAQVLADYASSLAPLGPIQSIEQVAAEPKGKYISRVFRIKAGGKELGVFSYFTADNKLAQFNVMAKPAQ